MSDKLVFDLAQEVEGSPSVFVRKDWLNILDNQNQNYNNNQSIIDTSQLSNSNKYMSYRESYLLIPFLITLGTTGTTPGAYNAGDPTQTLFQPATAARSGDYAIGLKNWFGQIIHSFTLDYNGTTIVQQTPFINMWNSFKLMTSLSLDDINTQGPTIGFYPDNATSWQFAGPVAGAAQSFGQGVCNNTNSVQPIDVYGQFNNFDSGFGNSGFLARQQLINFDADGVTYTGGAAYSTLLVGGTSTLSNLWKSYIFNKRNQTAGNAVSGMLQISVTAVVYLKHVHSFFNMCPLLKGVFMKMTMNLNNTSTTFSTQSVATGANVIGSTAMVCQTVSNPLGGVNPLMIASTSLSNITPAPALPTTSTNGGFALCPGTPGAAATAVINYRLNISVGARCLDAQLAALPGGVLNGPSSQSVYLYIPAYTFNPVFEQAYLSSPVKQIKYTDVYQYQVLNIASDGTFNNLLTNGIANVKSVLVLPFYSTSAINTTTAINAPAAVDVNNNTAFLNGTPVWQSPFDTAGTGTTSPLCYLTNFNIQVSGQNAIYNTQRYNFEQFNNQLYGQNAVNGGLTDGITSGQINRQNFDMNYSYYYVNVERMLPVEMSVPKSIQLLGQNKSGKALDLYCFIEYGVEVSIDVLTGSRV